MKLGTQCDDRICVGVVELPDTSNYMELEGFGVETDVRITVIKERRDLSLFDAVIISGVKNPLDNLNYLTASGLAAALRSFAEAGGSVFGVCAGYVMLAKELRWSAAGVAQGVGLLPCTVQLLAEPQVTKVSGQLLHPSLAATSVAGYDVSLGKISRLADSHSLPLLRYPDGEDGLTTPGLQVGGANLYNIFWNDVFRNGWLNLLRTKKGLPLEEVIPTPQCHDHCGENVTQFVKITTGG